MAKADISPWRYSAWGNILLNFHCTGMGGLKMWMICKSPQIAHRWFVNGCEGHPTMDDSSNHYTPGRVPHKWTFEDSGKVHNILTTLSGSYTVVHWHLCKAIVQRFTLTVDCVSSLYTSAVCHCSLWLYNILSALLGCVEAVRKSGIIQMCWCQCIRWCSQIFVCLYFFLHQECN